MQRLLFTSAMTGIPFFSRGLIMYDACGEGTFYCTKLVSNREVSSTISRDMLDNFFMDFGQ